MRLGYNFLNMTSKFGFDRISNVHESQSLLPACGKGASLIGGLQQNQRSIRRTIQTNDDALNFQVFRFVSN